MEEGFIRLFVFSLGDHRFALHLDVVERAVRVAEITPVPRAPGIVLGIISVEGRILPVLNVRLRFRVPQREIHLSDSLIIARTSRRPVAILVDSVEGLIERPEQEMVKAEAILPRMEYVEGVVKLDDGLVLIHDLDCFLSLEEEEALAEAIEGH